MLHQFLASVRVFISNAITFPASNGRTCLRKVVMTMSTVKMPAKQGVFQRRRPALIPADAELTEEDARSIKLRIGDRIPIAPFEGRDNDMYLAKQRAMEQEESLKEQVRTPIVRGSELNENGKRKASTSAEEHQKIIDSPRQEPSDALKSGNDTEMLDSEKDRDS